MCIRDKPEILKAYPEVMTELVGEITQELLHIIKIFRVKEAAILYLDAADGRAVCRLIKTETKE